MRQKGPVAWTRERERPFSCRADDLPSTSSLRAQSSVTWFRQTEWRRLPVAVV